jgi:hypothetical protein
MQTELGTQDHTMLRPLNTLFPLFPLNTQVTSMVAVLQTDPRTLKISALFSQKLLFPDGSEAVIGAPTRLLWAGADGVAFGVDPRTVWKIAAARNKHVIISAGAIPANG